MAEGYEGYQGYGVGGGSMDPATMRSRLAMAMLQQGSDASPARSPWQGAARLSQALFGALMLRQQQSDYGDSWKKALAAMPTGAAGGGLAGGAAGPSADLPAQPNALADLANDPDLARGVANAGTNGLPDSATIGQSLARGAYPPTMGPPIPAMAPGNAAGGINPSGPMPGGALPPGGAGGGTGSGSMMGSLGLPPQGIQVASNDPTFVPQPQSGNGRGAGPGAFNPEELAMFQQDMQAVPGSAPNGAGGGSQGGAGLLDQLKANIARTESQGSGGYSAMGPVTGSGDRAFGKYQVMGANIPQWTQAALGQPMTPQQFLASPQAQEAVVNHRLGGYLNQFGPEGAARAWFTGSPTGKGADLNGMTGDRYAALATQGLGAPGQAMAFGGQTPAPPPSPAVGAIQNAAGAPQGLPASMQPNMMVAGPGAPSMGRGGGNPSAVPPPLPPDANGGGNPLSALGNMFGMGNPSSPQGGNGPAPAGGGVNGAQDPRMQGLLQVLSDPYAAPGAKQVAMQFLQYYMPHPTEWRTNPGTNDQQGFNPVTGQPIAGQFHAGPHKTSVQKIGTDILGQEEYGVFDKNTGQLIRRIGGAGDGQGAGANPSVSPPQPSGPPSSVPPGNIPPPNPSWTPQPQAGGTEIWHQGGSPSGPIEYRPVPAPGPTQTTPPVGAAPQPQPAPTGSGASQPFTAYQVQGEDRLPALEQKYAAQYGPEGAHMAAQAARGLMRGDQTALSGQAGNKGVQLLAMTMAHDADPQFSPVVSASRAKTYNDYNNGSEAGSPHVLMLNANSALSHLGDLVQANKALAPFQSNNWGALNGLTNAGLNAAMKGNAPGAKELSAYRANLEPFVGEMNKFYSGSAGTQQDREDMSALADPSKSPIERGAALQRLSLLLQGKGDELQREWHNSMGAGSADYPLIGQQGQQAIKDAVSANVPPDKVQLLLQNPGKAADFDAKYGPGSSRAILGR